MALEESFVTFVSFVVQTQGVLVENRDLIASVLQEALPYINYLVNKTIVIKLGGSALDEQDSILQDIVWLRSLRANPVLIHGGGPYISAWLRRIGKESRFIDGLRVTDEETMTVARMVLVGQINQELVRIITRLGGRAIGLSGLDGAMIRAQREDEALGLVGRVDGHGLDLRPIEILIEQGYIPIIAPIGLGQRGECLNINADMVAAEIARAMRAEKLILLTNVVGICDRAGQLISELTASKTFDLIEQGVITGGMIPKVHACIYALETVRRTHIIDGRVPHVLIRELFTDGGAGTMITHGREDVPA
jgi:acetylglutamate kinase